MTRIIRVETCDRCPHAYGSRGCRHPEALVDIDGVQTLHLFDDYLIIPAWCPLEQDGPDWRPPVCQAVVAQRLKDRKQQKVIDA